MSINNFVGGQTDDYVNVDSGWYVGSVKLYTKTSSMRRPSSTWVILDEREDSINDSVFIVDMSNIADPNYDSFTIVDYLAAITAMREVSRLRTATLKSKVERYPHGSAVEEGRILQFSQPSPNNPDVRWMRERTSEPEGR